MNTPATTLDDTIGDTIGASCGSLMSVEQASRAIRQQDGGCFSIAGDEQLLRRLPSGLWIAGSIPYFMGQDGGATTRDRVFVTPVPVPAGRPGLRWYDEHDIRRVCVDAPAHGFTLLVLPAFSAVHSAFAREAPNFEDMYVNDVEYRQAQAVDDYPRAFARALPGDAGGIRWSCNCILNYLYSELEGKRTGRITGPMTFGEVAYQLLNQTMVYLRLESNA